MQLEVSISEDAPLFVTMLTHETPLLSNGSKGSAGVGHIISGVGDYRFGLTAEKRQRGKKRAFRGGFTAAKHFYKFKTSDLKNARHIGKMLRQHGLGNATENWARIKIPRGPKRFIVKNMPITGPFNLGQLSSFPGAIVKGETRSMPNAKLLRSAGKLSGAVTKTLKINIALETMDWLYQAVEAKNEGRSLRAEENIKAISNIGGAIGGSYVAAFAATLVAGISTAGLPAVVVIAFPIVAGFGATLGVTKALNYLLNEAHGSIQSTVGRQPSKQEVTRFLREAYGLPVENDLTLFSTEEVSTLLNKQTRKNRGCTTIWHH